MKRKALILLSILLCIGRIAFSQNEVAQNDESLIKQTALDYAEGFYTGDATRMERAIHPDLNKATFTTLRRSGRETVNYSTYSQLIELTRAKVGLLDKDKQNLSVTILNIEGDVANAKVISAKFNDYLQLVKIDGQWKIINVLWTAPNRIKDFNQDSEKDAIRQIALYYADGVFAADVKKTEMACHGEFNRVSINPIPGTTKFAIIRQRLQGAIESGLAKQNKYDEVYRHYQVDILDVMDGMAVVKVTSANRFDFLQCIKTDNDWKVFNAIIKNKTNIEFSSLLPALLNEPMPDFTLPIFGGGEFTLSKYKGKNVLLVFPRGWVGTVWCPYCPYHYLELADMDKKENIRKKYNLEIVFVMPYGSDRIADWFDKFPDALKSVDQLKNLPEPRSKFQNDIVEYANKHFPKKFDINVETSKKALPVLVDSDRFLSKKLELFTNFWDGVTAEQNIPAVYIIDKNGVMKYKYLSQITEDRPNMDYILQLIKNLK